MKKFKLILKAILFYFTLLFIIVFMCSIDALSGTLIGIGIVFSILLIVINNCLINKEEFLKITFNKNNHHETY